MSILKLLPNIIALAFVIQFVQGFYYNEGVVAEPACRLCKTMTKSFKGVIEATRNEHYETNDAWFSDVMQRVCTDVDKSIQYECKELAKKYKLFLHAWWENDLIKPGLYKWLCIDELKICCPPLHYGKNCTRCDGYPLPCSDQGICDGDGTRAGDGHCICIEPYFGKKCETCKTGYYGTYRMSDGYTTLICKPCHKACQNGCSSGGPQGCRSCATGWYWNGAECADVNECTDETICGTQAYCVNTPGSFYCPKCHSSCKSCYGPAPTECTECDDRHKLDHFKHVCIPRRFPKASYEVMIAQIIFGMVVGAVLIEFPKIFMLVTIICLGIFIAIQNIDLFTTFVISKLRQVDINASHAWNIINSSLTNFFFNEENNGIAL